MNVELRHLRVVVLVAEAGSVGRAARRLKVSQPSYSPRAQLAPEVLQMASAAYDEALTEHARRDQHRERMHVA